MYKKFIIILCAILLITTLPAGAFIPLLSDNESIGKNNLEAIEKLNTFNLLWDDFNPHKGMTRADLANVVMKLFGMSYSSYEYGGEAYFNDVKSNTKSAVQIYDAVNSGVLAHYKGENFYPDQKITFEELFSALEILLGYNTIYDCLDRAQSLITASMLKLDYNVVVKEGVYIKNEYAAQIVLNALDVPVFAQTNYGENPKFGIVKDSTILTCLKIYENIGRVKAVGATSLFSGEKMPEGKIQIGDGVYNAGNTEYENLLGYNVKFYVKDNGDGEEFTVLYAKPHNNSEITVNADDIEIADTTSFTYRIGDRKKTIKISQSVDVIYNKKTVFDFEGRHLMPKNGNVKLIDNDNDGMIDVVLTDDYKNIVTDDIRRYSSAVTDMKTKQVIDLDKDNYNQFKIIKNGAEVGFEVIKRWDVLSVYEGENETDGKYIFVYISDKTVSGKITQTDSENNVYSDGERFIRAYGFDETLTVGEKAILLLDYTGKIAGSRKSGAAGKNLAMLIDMSEDGTIAKKVQFKLFTTDNTWVVHNVADNIKIDSTPVDNQADLLTESKLFADGTKGGVLIVYDLNSKGEITSIQTATEDMDITNPKNPDLFRQTSEKLQRRFTNYTNSFMPESRFMDIYIDSSTLVFRVPTNSADKYDTEKYSVANMNIFVSNNYYMIESYHLTEEVASSALVYYTNDNTDINSRQSLSIVEKVVTASRSDGETVQKLYAYNNGSLIAVEGDNNYVFANLKRGDVIQYSTNAKGSVQYAERYFDINNPPLKKQGTTQISPTAIVNITNDFCTIYGEVYKKNGEFLTLYLADNPDTVPKYLNYSTSKAKIYLFDSESDVIKVISAGDIEPGQMVFMRSQTTQVMDILVIK